MRGHGLHSNSSKSCILGKVNLPPQFSNIVAEKTTKNSSGCLIWKGHSNKKGYGRMQINKRVYSLHRLVMLNAGELTALEFNNPKIHILHHCDTPACLNLLHLYVGNNQQNMNDKFKRGRTTRGIKNVHAKLIEADVLRIRGFAKSGLSMRRLAALYEVSFSTISRIVKRDTWRHL